MPSVLLVGFMGCGKTSAASGLAGLLGYPWVDLDAEIERAEGLTIPEIFARSGEQEFRSAESRQLERWLDTDEIVIATGGGLFVVPENRGRIQNSGARSVFLDVPWPVLERRIKAADSRTRPMFLSSEDARKLLEERLPSYRLADITVSLSGDETSAEVASLVHREVAGVLCAT